MQPMSTTRTTRVKNVAGIDDSIVCFVRLCALPLLRNQLTPPSLRMVDCCRYEHNMFSGERTFALNNSVLPFIDAIG